MKNSSTAACLAKTLRTLPTHGLFKVVPLDASSGLVANVGASVLVLIASPLGLPVSTTHVSTSALLGVRWVDKIRPKHADALRLVLYGWLMTLPVAAAMAALSSWLLQ